MRLVGAVADLSAGQIGAGLVNLDLKLGHVYLMPGEPLRAQLIDFDYESTYHLAGARLGRVSCAGDAGTVGGGGAQGRQGGTPVLRRAPSAPLRALAAKDAVCAAKVERHAPHLCKAHCLERRTNEAYDHRSCQPPGGAPREEPFCGAGRAWSRRPR